MTDFAVDLQDDWIVVPNEFPYDRWADSTQWAKEISTDAFEKDALSRERFESIARRLAALDTDEVDLVLWFAPLDGSTMGIAYLTVFEAPAAGFDRAGFARDISRNSATPPQIRRYSSVAFGEVTQIAVTSEAGQDTGTDGDTGTGAAVLGGIWTVGSRDGYIIVLHTVDEDLATLAIMMSPLIQAIEGIRPIAVTTDAE